MERELILKLDQIHEDLCKLYSLLQRQPEIQAGVLIQMQQEADAARMRGKAATDLWTIVPPNLR